MKYDEIWLNPIFKSASSSQWRFQSKGRSGTWRRHWWVSPSPNFGGCPWGNRLRCHLPSATPHPSDFKAFSKKQRSSLHSDQVLIQNHSLDFSRDRDMSKFRLKIQTALVTFPVGVAWCCWTSPEQPVRPTFSSQADGHWDSDPQSSSVMKILRYHKILVMITL